MSLRNQIEQELARYGFAPTLNEARSFAIGSDEHAGYYARVCHAAKLMEKGDTVAATELLRQTILRSNHAELFGSREDTEGVIKHVIKLGLHPWDDPKYQSLSLSHLIKLLGVNSRLIVATFQPTPANVLAMMAVRATTGGWQGAADLVAEYGNLTWLEMAKQQLFEWRSKIALSDDDLFAMWPGGPDVDGASTTPVTASVPSPVPAFPQTKGVSSMNTTNMNDMVRNIVNVTLQQAGVQHGIDELLHSVGAYSEAQREKAAMEQSMAEAKAEIERWKQAAAAATAAVPATMTMASTNTTIPNGTMEMVPASDLFPEMTGLSLKVPRFTWEHPHPDVPAINRGYIIRRSMLVKVLRALVNSENVWLQGHTGSGKTTFIEQVAARLGWPVARVAYDSNVDRSELMGRMQLIPDGKGGTASQWLPGILERAISGPYILLCDELDAGHPNALYTLQPLLEGKGLTLLEDGGRIVQRHPFARIMATGNTTGNGDPAGLYPACRVLSAATLDRFSDFVNVPYMTPDEERALIERVAPSISDKLAQMLAKFANEMRVAFVAGETPISYSPRRSLAFARMIADLKGMGVTDEPTAISIAFVSKLYDATPDEHRQRLVEIARAAFGGVDVKASV